MAEPRAEVNNALIFETLKSIQHTLDRLDARIERIERRLDLVEG